MPHNPELTPKKHAFRVLLGQKPLTRFKNYEKSIKVDLIKHDNPRDMLRGTYDFVKATWSLDGRESERASKEEMEAALGQMLSGKTLQLGLETVNFMFRISGITRIDTHQIVRQRIGVTFSQQCSGDQFWNHQDCLVEPSIGSRPRLYEKFRYATIEAKQCYADMVDSGVSIQAARSILPHNLETFIFMNVNLATLLFFHQKRINDGSQTWAINSIAQQMADRVTEVFPQLGEVFEKNKTRFRFQAEASADRTNSFSTGLYLPVPDEFEYHERDFLYNRTKNEMHCVGKYAQEVPPAFYWGKFPLTKEEFDEVEYIYERIDEIIHEKQSSNSTILSIGHFVNGYITSSIGKNPIDVERLLSIVRVRWA